jgi:hypothetical protein
VQKDLLFLRLRPRQCLFQDLAYADVSGLMLGQEGQDLRGIVAGLGSLILVFERRGFLVRDRLSIRVEHGQERITMLL